MQQTPCQQHPTASILVLSPPYSCLTYSLPSYLPAESFLVGQRAAIPLGKSLRVGIVTGFTQATETENAGFTLKPIAWPLERQPLLSASYLDLVMQLAQRQMEPPGRILGNVLPAGLRNTKIRIRFFGDGAPREMTIRQIIESSEEECAALGRLWVENRAEVIKGRSSPLDTEICFVSQDPPWPVRPAARAQTALLEYLYENGPVSRRKLFEELGKTASATLAVLAERELVRIRPEGSLTHELTLHSVPARNSDSSEECKNCFELTLQQRTVFENLHRALEKKQAETHLLFGITGSGKTAIYLELARATLAMGRSAVLLAPEVALALKLQREAEAALPTSFIPPERRHLYHGYQSPLVRETSFRKVREGGPHLVIGTRSALLLPLDDVGLIILDEEHDSSFKQDEGLNYQAKELAWYKAKTENALLLLASATPDIKSFHAAKEGILPLHTLTERISGGSLPEVHLVQMPKTNHAEGSCLLAPESMDALNSVVSKGEQAVILLNRRGYAPIMYCRSCSTVSKCPHCDISLAYHKGRERLVCHYCGFSAPFPVPCAQCKGLQFLPMGEGTEKLEENLEAYLPAGTKVLRLDRDSTRRPGRMEEILAAFARKEASVLVGTQMLSKGHHFPDVTLAIIADADLGLNLPDYRSAERTFQLLLQSSGRSGRGDKPGKVFIQTREPSHYCWSYVLTADYENFFAHELALRKKRSYPPFIRLALIRITYPADKPESSDELTALGQFIRSKAREMGITALGPAPAPLPLIKGQRRYHCLLKGKDWPSLRTLFTMALEASRKSMLRLRLDLDPLSML